MAGTIPFLSSNDTLQKQASKILSNDGWEICRLATCIEAVEYLDIEMPELILLDMDERSGATELLASMQSDPWLHHGGIIAFCRTFEQAKVIEEIREVNLIGIVSHEDIQRDLSRIMAIVGENRGILFLHEIRADFVQNISASYKLRNDILETRCYANIVCNFLYNAHKIDINGKNTLNLVLIELLINAIEHGNCGITYEEKSEHLEKGMHIEELISKKCLETKVAERSVTFEYTLTNESARFSIADEGEGFDWQEFQNSDRAEKNLLDLHGRGITISRSLVNDLHYSEKGNVVVFEFPFKTDIESFTPVLFSHIGPKEVPEGEIIFREGEPSNFLYYIVKGYYDVIVNDMVISQLSPDDVFMGEMSFLLNNKRSATVRAKTPGKLLEISKKAFVEATKRKPHYAIFLSRLLAERVQRLNNSAANG